MESCFDSVQNECTQTMGMLGREFERDRPTERHAQDRGALQSQMIDQEGQIMGVLANVTNRSRVALEIAPRETVSPQSGEDHIEVTSQHLSQREEQLPASGQARHQNQRVASTQSNNIHPLAADPNRFDPALVDSIRVDRPRSTPLRR